MQKIQHAPGNGVFGDCFRACVASLLELPAEDVPHFCETGMEGAVERCDAWLNERGLALFAIPFTADSPELVMRTVAHNNDGIYYLLTGTSRSGCNHSVVCLGDSIAHDPSPISAGIVGPTQDGFYWVEVLVHLEPPR